MSRSRKKQKPLLPKRRAARLAAVQALYQCENAQQSMAKVVAEFDDHRLGAILAPLEDPELVSPEVDREWFKIVAEGAASGHKSLDDVLAGCLKSGWTLARCGFLLRACLRAGAFELQERTDVQVATVISEYVELARLFLSSDEAAFVHAVLDRAARELRPQTTAL